MKNILLLILFLLVPFFHTSEIRAQTPANTPSCAVLISGELTLLEQDLPLPYTCDPDSTKEECFDDYYQARVVASNAACASVPSNTSSLDYSLYQQLRTKFLTTDSAGATPTPPPISGNFPDPGTVQIPDDGTSVSLEKFNDQLDQTLCTAYEGSACCMGGVPFDSQELPDPSSDSSQIAGGVIARLWGRLKDTFNNIFKSSQLQSTRAISALQWQQGLCPLNEQSELQADGVTPVKYYPYFWKADANGKATQELIRYENTEGNLIYELNRDLAQVGKVSFSKQEELWTQMKQKVKQSNATCTCNQPSDDMSVPKVIASGNNLSFRQRVNNVLGVDTGPSVLGSLSPDMISPQDGIMEATYKMQPYCQGLSPDVMRERFATEDAGECALVMAKSYFRTKKICDGIKNLRDDRTGEYDQEEYAACYTCTLEEDGVWTAFGCIYSDFGKTMNEKVFGLALSIGGLVSLGCIIYASFLMQTSAGSPERTGKAQELMTSCITGLIVIIFSVFILRVIGVDILRIPGFSGQSSDTDETAAETGSTSPTPIPLPSALPPYFTPVPTAIPTVAVAVVPTEVPLPTVPPVVSPSAVPTVAIPTSTPIPTAVPTPVLAQYVCGDQPEANEVYLYDKEMHQGACLRLTEGQYENFHDIQNPSVAYWNPWSFIFGQCDNWHFEDCIGSLVMGSDVQIELYPHRNYGGTPLRVTVKESTAQIKGFADKASSAIICRKPRDMIETYICPRN